MFRVMIDHGGDIKTGIKSYSSLVSVKSLLETLSPDLVKAYAGEEVGVGLQDIGNTLAESWSELSVAKTYLEESFVTDADESLTKIVNRTEELWKKYHDCLRPVMEYNIERHVKKYGPITQETML